MKKNQQKVTITFFLSLLFVFSSQVPSNALFGPKSGEKCTVKGEIKKIGGTSHVCEQSKDGQNRWLVNSAPKDRAVALGLVLENCGSDYDGKYSVYIFPRMIFGAVIQKTIESGDFKPDKKAEPILDYEITRSQEMSSYFEMASALDPKWNRINSFWTAAINAAYKRWQSGGVNQLEAAIASQSNLDSVESICKVAAKSGLTAANKEKRTVLSWIARVTSGY